MTTSPSTPAPAAPTTRVPLRVALRSTPRRDSVDGAWWPQSRHLQAEAADLVDHFPVVPDRIQRLLVSRPDWDDSVVDGHSVRRIQTARGPVKVGSFPSDDTRLMVLTMSSGRRLRLHVVASDTDPQEAERALQESVA